MYYALVDRRPKLIWELKALSQLNSMCIIIKEVMGSIKGLASHY